MVNHAFTVLLNEHPDRVATVLKDLYIDETFKPKILADTLNHWYGLLYGSAPDILGKLYKTAQLINLIQLSKYRDYLLYHDNRTNYKLDKILSGLKDIGFNRVIIRGSQDNGPYVDGGVYSSDTGRATTLWAAVAHSGVYTIKNITSKEATIRNKDQLLVLPGSDLILKFKLSPPDDGYWSILNIQVPKPTLADISCYTEDAINGLFKTDSPYTDFSRIYLKSTLPVDKIIAITLGVLFRLSE